MVIDAKLRTSNNGPKAGSMTCAIVNDRVGFQTAMAAAP
jgi:hypothetical protein